MSLLWSTHSSCCSLCTQKALIDGGCEEQLGPAACYQCRVNGIPCYKFAGKDKCVTCGPSICSHSFDTHNGLARATAHKHLQAVYSFLEPLAPGQDLDQAKHKALESLAHVADSYGGLQSLSGRSVAHDSTGNLQIRRRFERKGLAGFRHVPAFRHFVHSNDRYRRAMAREERRRNKMRSSPRAQATPDVKREDTEEQTPIAVDPTVKEEPMSSGDRSSQSRTHKNHRTNARVMSPSSEDEEEEKPTMPRRKNKRRHRESSSSSSDGSSRSDSDSSGSDRSSSSEHASNSDERIQNMSRRQRDAVRRRRGC